MREGQNSAPTSRRSRVHYGKLGTMPHSFIFYRRYALTEGQLVWWRDPGHCTKWRQGRVTNHDPLRITNE